MVNIIVFFPLGCFSAWFTMCELGAERILMSPNELSKTTQTQAASKCETELGFWGEIRQINWEFQGDRAQVFGGGIT